MDEVNICKLAKLLRETGDEVLQGDKTLLLSDKLLESLKDSFKFLAEEIDSDTSFLVTKTNNSPEAIFRDIQFIHDFIQKVVRLSVSKDTSKSPRKDKIVDINKFRSLKTLEVSNIPIQYVCGILQVRGHLQHITCSHSILQLKDLLINCGADHAIAQIWEELNEVVLSHNALGGIDGSFYYTPLLHKIDLSHNRLKNFCIEDCLPHLKYLNLSFNLLHSVPVLGKEGAGKLKVLLLKNNFLTDLTGLQNLKSIVELDLSCNRLFHHNTLAPLAALPLLNWINLLGNPLSFCSNHRANTVQQLHLNTACGMLTLDGLALSWREKKRVRRRGEQRLRAVAAVGPVVVGEAAAEEGERSNLLRSFDSTVSTDSAGQGSNDLRIQGDEDFNSSVVHVKSKKSLKQSKRQRQFVKEAVISESLKEQEETATFQGKGSDQQHLQVKQHVEQLRERFGEDNWLSERGATHLQEVLGLPRASPPAFLHALAQHLKTEETQSPQDARKCPTSSEETKTKNVPSDININEQEDPVEKEILASSDDWEEEEVETWVTHSQNEEEDVGEGKLFTVRKEKSSDLLLLAVGVHSLQERDVITGRMLQQWDLSTLQSCELLSEVESSVRLTFNVLRRDRRSRVYNVESSEAKMLLEILVDILSSRSLSEMNQVAYRCMKCSTQFSQEEDVRFGSRGKTVLCPHCSSNIVCVMEEAPLPAARALLRQPPEPTISFNLPLHSTPPAPSLSSSQSSIGSKDSCFPPAAAESARDCCLQVAAVVSPSRPSPPPATAPRSAASLEESINSSLNARRCDSDIEVISNPSQSSIEVIDGESRTPGRKRSSEERQPALVSGELNFKTVSNPAMPSLGLTESSSSGSFTDSICTTYETQRSAANGSGNGELSPTEQRHQQRQQTGVSNHFNRKNADGAVAEVDEDALYETGPIPSVQEMFEGLLEKVDKKLATSADLKPISNELDNTLHYSYSDFQLVDHRLRLFFLQELLDSHEELLMVLRADALKFDFDSPFPSLLVFSSAHFWLLEVTGTEGDNPETWLQERMKLPISCVNAVFPLPWAQGVGLSCKEPDRYILMLLQDSQRTSNFIQAAESLLPESCGVVNEPANYHHQFFSEMLCSNFGESESKLHLVSLFNSFNIEGEDVSSVECGVVIVQEADIYVIESNFIWLFPNKCDNSAIKKVAAQQISNLMEVVTDDCHIGLHFVDETRHKEETWNLVFQTAACVQTVVTAVRTPWEQLFSVPLQVTERNQQQL